MIPARMAIYVAAERLDLRRSFDGLSGVVREVLREDPLSGALFMFFNKAADRVKILWWDRTGYCLLYKRLERGTFRVPQGLEPGATRIPIEASEMARILEGIQLPPAKQRTRALEPGSIK
ncbi:IS66 family insertion sequence element accessory protein TnpB [Polyangium sp. 15x6]|jgi:transposase|uniref:IS66 family insertion sequence element accessory protein TnpB n=1 Tax=Polyangium sp. 15x6 TaxID=3042687 RepID=UPI00249A872B|nr:IS66 family insertion sequence element accessory protein TnpB [Polyangium sp. 15x6]MDI3292111.1 IS66 family insertion sequence element accessory protein TnpB [Polyangium sp. 15x6]